jgi:hypothetical protein
MVSMGLGLARGSDVDTKLYGIETSIFVKVAIDLILFKGYGI